jgi:acyl transferase domain-containing protein/ubiquinone/menaquinone biosynthesis C-methylase UbiE
MNTNLNNDKPQTFEKEPIAIIGMGCRFPGGADSPEAFWKLLRDGTDAITEVPIERWNWRAFYDPEREKPGKICTRYGGFIEKIDEFDADFFGISPREAKRIDPQHRILLEIAYEALQDGGQVPERLAGTSTGVFIGISFNDYLHIQTSVSDRDLVSAYTQLGGMLCIAANRISYAFNFTGPSLSVDTACSSSLQAVHLACQSIWNQESTMALAGGVNALLKPESTIGFSKASMLSPDGRCKSFDAGANGYVRAEGAGIVVLKPLSRALADSDPIYAVIRGSAVNSDGRTNGITMPSEKGQEAVLREAYRQAGVLPEQVQYIEAHGTGTPVGDPIEANAIGNLVGKGRQEGSYCIIGSVKSNIGHLEPASGIAGLIKAALALKYRQIPPSLHLVTPNPEIPFHRLGLRVAQTLEPWSQNDQKPRIAGVNSFGFGGTNAHVVLSDLETLDATSRQSPLDVRTLLLPLSAKTPEALQAVAKVTHEFVSASDNARVSLSDICYTASRRRSHHEERLAVVADSCDGMAENLRAFLAGETRLGMSSGCLEPDKSPKLAFVFSGMGQQWWAMGRQLLQTEPVFRESIKRCDELLREYADWSLWDELTASEENSPINETQFAQCSIFAVQVALSALWRSWGIIPSAIVGHSVGEVAAAHVAGVLNLEDAVRVIFHRSRLHATTAGRGKMLAIALLPEEAQRVLVGYEERVSIAVFNSPTGLTLSGDTQALGEIAAILEQKEIFCRFLQVEVPYHSVLMEPLKAELEKSLQGINPQPATIPLFSTVTGKQVSGPEVDAEYWGQNMRNPVLFAEAVDGLMKAGYDLFLEIGAHPVLANYISECFVAAKQTATVLPSMRRKEAERAMMLGSIGKLYTLGYSVDWDLLYSEGGQFVKLPSYPWQRERYWLESSFSQQARLGESSTLDMLSKPIHPLLGSQLKSAQPEWKGLIDKQQLTYLNDHCIQGVVVYPGAAYIEMALAASKEIFGEEAYVLSEIEFQKALTLADNETPTLQLIVDSNQTSFEIHSHRDTEELWVKHATGKLNRRSDGSVPNPVMLPEYKNRCTKQISQSDVYRSFQEMGLEYGSCFQAIEQFFGGEKQALGQIRVNPTLEKQIEEYQIHPTILDACFQVLGGLVSLKNTGVYLPVEINCLRVYASPSGIEFWCYARLVEQSATSIKGDIQLLDISGKVLVEIQGLRLQSLEGTRETTPATIDNYLYEYQWRLKAHSEQELVHYLPTASQIALSVQPEADRLSLQHRRKQYYEVVEPQLDALSAAYIIQALHQLGWQPQLDASVGVNSVAEELGVAEQHRRLLGRMLEILHADGVLSKVGARWTVCQIPELQDTQKIWQELVAHNPSYIAELKLLGQCGPHLASVLRGDIDPLELIFPENSLTTSEHLYQDSPTSRIYNQLTQKAISTAVASLPKERTIRILEIGAGTGALTSYVLPVVPGNRAEYVFTDISQVFTAAAEQKFSDYPFISYQILDIEKDPIAQGFSAHSFDLILASDAIHATRDLRTTLTNVKQLLASSGLLVLLELTKAPRWSDLVFGLLKGWWLFSDLDLRQSNPLLCAQKWRDLLVEVGFEEVAEISDTQATPESLQTVFFATGPDVELLKKSSAGLNGSDQSQKLLSWLIFADSFGVGEQLAQALKGRSQSPILISPGTTFLKLDDEHFQIRTEHQEDIQQVLEALSAKGSIYGGIIHLWSLDTPPVEQTTSASLESAQTLGCLSVIHLVQALAKVNQKDSPRLFLVTNETQGVGDSVKALSIAQSPLWGLGRAIANEHPELRCTMVDLSQTISKVEIQSLFDELWSDSGEDEIALRGEARYVHRLVPINLEKKHDLSLQSSQNQNPFRLEISTPGVLDNLTLRATTRPKPDPHQVEIQVCATGLNFKDVAKAMNLLADVNLEEGFSGRDFGLECAGIITAIGSGVEGFQIGDEVIAVAAKSFGTYTTTDARLVVHKPPTLSFEEAATIPVVFLTAYYALHYLGRIAKGERVLIHAAAGGVGLAAIQIATAAGAEIFATAGSPEKRKFLKSLGVKYVMDSRSLAFADQVMELTDGQGVDIVLNSLAGEAIPKNLSILNAYGRFLEIGKLDIDKNSNLGLRPFQKNLSFFAVDLDRLVQERPDLGGSLFRELMQYFNSGTFHPLPHRVFPISQAVRAFRYMAQAKHIGKIVVDLLDPVVIPPVSEKKMTLSEVGTYLITGGLGGFGLAVAKWLVEHGARHLVLMGRSGAMSPTASSAVEAMKQEGAEVIVAKADVTDSAQLQRVLADIPENAPLRGIIHGAMVLDDALVVQLNSERMQKVMAPKMVGAWNLHTQTLKIPLDFFVMFSSFTSIVGNPGQGNYVAGSAFIDTLSHHRRAMGLPTLTLNWGSVGEVGYVAQNADISENLKRVGIKPMPLQKVLKKLAELMLQQQVVQTAVVDIDWHQWSQVYATGTSPRLSSLVSKASVSAKADTDSGKGDPSLNALVLATLTEQEQLLESRLSEQVAKIMGISVNKLDMKRSLMKLGLGSLMAVEISNWLKSELGVNVTTMNIMQGLSIFQLAKRSLEQLAVESIKLSVSSAAFENSEEEEEITL